MAQAKDLPEDLVAFLSARAELQYDTSLAEPGRIRLVAVGRHRVGEIWIYADAPPDAHGETDADTPGYYAVPAVNLIADCEHYDPDYILMWLPDQRMFGTWDSDHWEAHVFPGVGWQDIVADPIVYLNAQWEPDEVRARLLTPWPDYPFQLGSPV